MQISGQYNYFSGVIAGDLGWCGVGIEGIDEVWIDGRWWMQAGGWISRRWLLLRGAAARTVPVNSISLLQSINQIYSQSIKSPFNQSNTQITHWYPLPFLQQQQITVMIMQTSKATPSTMPTMAPLLSPQLHQSLSRPFLPSCRPYQLFR